MTTPLLLALVGAVVLVSLLLSAVCYWLMARLFRAERASFARGVAVAVVCSLISAAVFGAFASSPDTIDRNPVAFLLLAILANVVMPIIVAARIFRASLVRSLGIVVSAAALAGGAAFVLAIGVKATLIEAFFIPTGSMAPTIRGAHMERACRNCGREMIVGVSGAALQGPHEIRPRGIDVECVNCGHFNVVASDGNHADGERVVVDKLADAQRWDLVVFRKPDEPQVNFVKRFVGLPGERIEWLDGELFVDGELLRKPPGRMDSLWFPVNDSAFVPKELGGRTWISDADAPQWRRDDARWSATADGDMPAIIRFGGKIADSFEYNGSGHRRPADVADVLLRLTDVEVDSGELQIEWRWRRLVVWFDIGDDNTLTIRQSEPERREIVAGSFDRSSSQEEPLELAIRDSQAYARQGTAVLASGDFGPKTLTEFREMKAEEGDVPCELSIAMRHGTASIGRIELLRDIYYLSPDEIAAGRGTNAFIEQDGSIVLDGSEYLALGDNSASALDSRFWGPVPSGNIVGVAKWLYWPFKRIRTLD